MTAQAMEAQMVKAEAGLVLQRERQDANATQGSLLLDGQLLCRTLENRAPVRPGVKEPGQSRIPAGTWQLGLRCTGGFFNRYTARWDWHGPMVEVLLPGWKYVLFHVGNYHYNTDGCVLVGESFLRHPSAGLAVGQSRAAYERVYPQLRALAEAGAALTVKDEQA